MAVTGPLAGTIVKSFSPKGNLPQQKMQGLCAGTTSRNTPLISTSESLRAPRDCRRTIAAAQLPPYDKKNIRGAFMTEPSYEELKARLADLEKQVETKKRSGAIEFRVSEKGGVSVYGLGRFPVTLYYEQWTRLLDAAPDLKVFIEENKSKLKLKQG
jgi:hypothetical protein